MVYPSSWSISATIRSGVDIRSNFVEALRFADGWHMAPEAKISVYWERDGVGLRLDIEVPCNRTAELATSEKTYPLVCGHNRIAVALSVL